MIKQFLTPTLGRRGSISPGKAREIADSSANTKEIRARRRLRSDKAKKDQPQIYDPAAFDWRSHSRFRDTWQAELETLSPPDHDALMEKVRPYFCGATLDATWFEILRGLGDIKRAEAARYVPVYRVYHGRGAIEDGY